MSLYINHKTNQTIDLNPGKIVCIGRNYSDHIAELQNTPTGSPLLFIKPASSLCNVTQPISIPQGFGPCHNELELAILIGKKFGKKETANWKDSIWGYGLALDLTLRDLQTQLKEKGHPWEKAKGFDGACPISSWIPKADIKDPYSIRFNLKINGKMQQQGNPQHMIFNFEQILAEITQYFTLNPGDIILTGTPKGVGPLMSGDKLIIEFENYFSIQTEVKNG